MNQQPKKSRTRSIVRPVSILVLAIVMLSLLALGAAAAETTPKFVSAQPTLGETINLNFRATIPESDVDTAEVVFEYLGYTYPALKASEAKTVEENSETHYVFTLNSIAPQNITKPVKATLFVNGVAVDTKEYTVKQYCDYALANVPAAAKVAQAILNYSAAAKWYIGEIDEMPDIKNLPAKNHMSVVAEKALDAADGSEQATMDRVGLIISGSITTYFDFSTYLENPAFKVTVDGREREAVVINNDDGTYRALVELKATEIFSEIVATVTNPNGKDISRTATYSVTAYLHKFADDPDEALATFVRTIYAYGLFSHDLSGHEPRPVAFSGNKVVYDCKLCNERMSYTLSEKAYAEDYTEGLGLVKPYFGVLSNVDGTLHVVVDNTVLNNAEIALSTKKYVTTNSFLVGFDIKSAPNREADFGVLLKPNGGWDYEPKTGNSVYVTPAGQLKVFGNVVEGVTISQDEFTSIMLNFSVSQDTADENDVAVYTVDLWVDGRYFGQYTSVAKKTTGTTAIKLNDSTVQLSTRRIEGKYNEIFLDNVFMADGINAAGQNIVDLVTVTHNYETTTNIPVTNCYTEGKIVETCISCAKSVTTVLPALPHENITLTVQNGQLVATCPVCNENVAGGANWTSETLMLADGTNHGGSTSQNFNTKASNGEYHYIGKAGQWQPQFSATNQPKVDTRRGVVSIDVKGNSAAQWGVQLYNRGADWPTLNTYASGTAHATVIFQIDASNRIYATSHDVNKAVQSNVQQIGTINDSAYTRITVAFEKDVAKDTFLLDYYVDGAHVFSQEVHNFLQNDTPHGIYISITGVEATDLYLDNVMLAYSDNAEGFIQHTHSLETKVVEPSNCYLEGIANQVCTTCGYVADDAVIPKTEHQLNCIGFDKSNNAIYECSICENTFSMPVKKYDDFSTGSRAWYVGDADPSSAATNGEFLMVAKDAENAQFSPNTTAFTNSSVGVWGFSLKNTDVRGADFRTQLKVQNSKNVWGFNKSETQIRIKPDGSIQLGGKDTGLDISTTEYTDFLVKVTLSVSGSTTTATMHVWVNGTYVGEMGASLETTGATLNHGSSYLQLATEPSASGNKMYYDNIFIADPPAGLVAGANASSTMTGAHEQGKHKLKTLGIDASKNLVYECVSCKEHYAVPTVYGDTMSGDTITFAKPVDEDKERTQISDGAFVLSAAQGADNGKTNAYIPAYPKGKIKSTSTFLLGFDIKNTENRAGYFVIQWRTPCSAGNWPFDTTETKLEIKPDGSIYFATQSTDTGLDISTDKFTSILMKATLTVDGSNTKLSLDLWVNGAYVATASKTMATTNASWQTSDSGAQICLQTNQGTNEVILDNLFMADVPAGVTAGTALADSLSLIHNLGAADVVEPTCTETGMLTATCKVCGLVHTEVLPTLPHELTYTDTIATYKCSVCKNKYMFDGVYGEDYTGEGNLGKIKFDNGGNVEGNTVTNEDGEKILVTHSNAATANKEVINNSLTIKPGQYTDAANQVILGFSLMGNGTRYADITLQAKVSSKWNGQATRMTLDTNGNIRLNGVDTGYDLTNADFTRFVVMYTIVDMTLYFDLWINETYVGQGSQTFEVALTWQNDNSYVQLCLPTPGAGNSHSMYVDNVFIADVPTGVSGSDLGKYMIEAPHNFEEVTEAATCTKEGCVKRVCTDEDCGYEEIVSVIPKLGHSWPSQRAYDNEAHYYECARCHVRKGTAAHVWDEGQLTLEPTCETVGTRLYSCVDCGATKQVDVPKKAHSIDVTSGSYNELAATTSTVFGHGTTTYACTVCGQNVAFDTPIHYDYEGGQNIGAIPYYTFTAVTENGNTYGQYVSKSADARDVISYSAANTASAYSDGSFFKLSTRMIFSLKLKTADDHGIAPGTIFLRSLMENGKGAFYTLINWDKNGALKLPGFEDTEGNDDLVTEGDDGLELPPIDLIPARPTIHMNWTELTFDADLQTGLVDVYVNGEYVCTTASGFNGTYPVSQGQYITVKLNDSVEGDTAICIDDVKLVFAN